MSKPTDPGELLSIALSASVPLYILHLAALSPGERNSIMESWRSDAVESTCAKGDILQYGSKGKKGQVADVFNNLAKGLAVLAHSPGGVDFAGLHWEAHQEAEP